MALTDSERARYDRNILIPGLGTAGQERLGAARVLVVGAGGLGSPVLTYLAAAGVGNLTIADGDVVELSNLQRQVIHRTADLGTAKTASATRAVRDLNPDVRVRPLGLLVGGDMDEAVMGHDVVLDCTDNFAAKFATADACAAAGIPLVWGSIVSMTYQVTVLWSRPPAPFAPVTLRDIHPEPPPPGATDGAAQVGVLGAAVGQAGSVMATEAIKLITGVGEPLLGRLLIGDARAGRWDVIEVGRTP